MVSVSLHADTVIHGLSWHMVMSNGIPVHYKLNSLIMQQKILKKWWVGVQNSVCVKSCDGKHCIVPINQMIFSCI